MALTKAQANEILKVFIKGFCSCTNDNERKRMALEFDNSFRRDIPGWKILCKEMMEERGYAQELVLWFEETEKDKKQFCENITVRLLEEGDVPFVKDLIIRTFHVFVEDEKLERFIEGGYSAVACSGEDILGVILAYKIPSLNRDAFYMDTFAVEEVMRGRGIGRKLLSYIQALMKKEIQVYELHLQTDRQIVAYEMYKHWGFLESELVQMTKLF